MLVYVRIMCVVPAKMDGLLDAIPSISTIELSCASTHRVPSIMLEALIFGTTARAMQSRPSIFCVTPGFSFMVKFVEVNQDFSTLPGMLTFFSLFSDGRTPPGSPALG